MGGLAEQHRNDVDLRVLDDLGPLGREPLDAEVAGHRLAPLAVARRERGQPDRPGERVDVTRACGAHGRARG